MSDEVTRQNHERMLEERKVHATCLRTIHEQDSEIEALREQLAASQAEVERLKDTVMQAEVIATSGNINERLHGALDEIIQAVGGYRTYRDVKILMIAEAALKPEEKA